jgi:hypothetical protein
MNARPPLPPEVLAFDEFLNEPPEYESQRMVREFRHAAYPRWQKALDALLAQMLAAQSPAPAAPAPTSQWQDIATAPKDGTREMFVVKAFNVCNGFTGGKPYTSDPWCVWRESDGSFSRWPHHFPPTHWHPLSTAPEAK